MNNSRYIQNLSRCEYFDPIVLGGIEKKDNLSADEIDFLITYYLKPATYNRQKVLFWLKKRDIKNEMAGDDFTGNNKAVFVIEQMMKGWLANNHYDEVILLYNNSSDLLTDTKKSQHHIYLLVSAGYAGKGNINEAIKYLGFEFENTQVFDIPESDNTVLDYSLLIKGDMLYALFLMIHVIDEFEFLLKGEKINLIKDIVNKNINRYKHLKVFKPEPWEPIR
jgi:hypothetical protein